MGILARDVMVSYSHCSVVPNTLNDACAIFLDRKCMTLPNHLASVVVPTTPTANKCHIQQQHSCITVSYIIAGYHVVHSHWTWTYETIRKPKSLMQKKMDRDVAPSVNGNIDLVSHLEYTV